MRLRLYAKTLNMHTFWSPGWKVAKYAMCKYATLHYVQLKVKNKLKAVLKLERLLKHKIILQIDDKARFYRRVVIIGKKQFSLILTKS